MTTEDVAPDTKDWTWVLDRPCPECGFVAGDVRPEAVGRRLRANAARWVDVLTRPDVGRRPEPGVWSPLEYGCHVRDVHRVFQGRVRLMLEHESPTFENWDQDATAVAEWYAGQDPSTVAEELLVAAVAAAETYDGVADQAWDRPGLRSNGSRFTVASISRYHLHDVVHHLQDVTPEGAGR